MSTTPQWEKSIDKIKPATEIVLEIDKHAPDVFPSIVLESIEKSIDILVFHALQEERKKNIDLIVAAYPEIGRQGLEYLLSK